MGTEPMQDGTHHDTMMVIKVRCIARGVCNDHRTTESLAMKAWRAEVGCEVCGASHMSINLNPA
jgi:hypothetical protein